jgi:hypothetical protein
MGKRDTFWDQVPTDDEDQIRWPDDADERLTLVRDVFGARVIGALESALEEDLEVADGRSPTPGSPNYEQEAARRQVFAGMSDEQRAEVRRLLKSACFGALYWVLVKLEHFPQGNVDFTVEPYAPGGKAFPTVGIEETELHHLYFDWMERFSDHGD